MPDIDWQLIISIGVVAVAAAALCLRLRRFCCGSESSSCGSCPQAAESADSDGRRTLVSEDQIQLLYENRDDPS